MVDMITMAHVQPHHVHARMAHRPNDCGIGAGWSNGGDHLGAFDRPFGEGGSMGVDGHGSLRMASRG